MKANLFSIGGMRCGSTTIYHHLSSHPQIYMSPVKEPYFFSAEYWKKKRQRCKAVAKRTDSSKQNNTLRKIPNS